MKEGWEYKRLKDVATFSRGLTYSKNDEVEISNNIVLRSNNVDLSTGKLNLNDLKYLRPNFSIPEEKKVKKGSLLMCMSNGSKIHLGKVALINKDFPYAFGGFMALVTPNQELTPQFFHYSLSSPEYKDFIKKLSAGANINNIKVKELELFTIPVPPLSEQQRIVDYLDAAFAKIDAMKANAEKSLDEAKALFQASLKEMLEPKEGWKSVKLINIYNFIDYRGATPKKITEGVPLVTAKNVKLGYIDYTIKDYISEEEYKQRQSRGISHKGDLLFTTEAPLGNVAIADLERFSAGQRLITLQKYKDSKHEIDNRFYYYYMLGPLFQKKIQSLATGATALGIKAKILKEVEVPLPTNEDQQSIVATLDALKSKVDSLQANFEKISQECDALKQALLREVFEG